MKSWANYFTPPSISTRLIGSIAQPGTPKSAVDICAGTGNLLLAVRQRWPNIKLVGNDRYRRSKPTGVGSWSCRDGRNYAREAAFKKISYDIVVANPPFGNEGQRRRHTVDPTLALLEDPRIEVAMTVAAALLVGPRGVLATVLPETLIMGETHVPLRDWLSRRFCCFRLERIPRGEFRNLDLGLVLLVARRTHAGPCGGSFDLKNIHNRHVPLEFEAFRGSIASSMLHPMGELPVVHCASAENGTAVTQRSIRKDDLSMQTPGRLCTGDILVSRVGRGAGRATIFHGTEGTLFSDCVFRLRATRNEDHEKLQQATHSGRLERELRRRARGLGASYVTKLDLEHGVRQVLGQGNDTSLVSLKDMRSG
jgi:hypothetical protein